MLSRKKMEIEKERGSPPFQSREGGGESAFRVKDYS